MRNIIRSKSISKSAKKRIYKTNKVSTKWYRGALKVFERKIARRIIYGGKEMERKGEGEGEQKKSWWNNMENYL